jgi:hypothetical protein
MGGRDEWQNGILRYGRLKICATSCVILRKRIGRSTTAAPVGKPALAGGKVACPARGLEAWPACRAEKRATRGIFPEREEAEARFTLEATDRLFARDRDMHTSPRGSKQLARLLGSGTV